jgi:hypothetical protein
MNNDAFAVDDADVGLVHRDVEASKIVPVIGLLFQITTIVSVCVEEPPPITRC